MSSDLSSISAVDDELIDHLADRVTDLVDSIIKNNKANDYSIFDQIGE